MDRVRAHVARLNGQQSQATLPQVGLVSLAQSPAQPVVEEPPLFAAQPSSSNLLFADEVDANTPEATAAQPNQLLIPDELKEKAVELGGQVFDDILKLPQYHGNRQVPTDPDRISHQTFLNYSDSLKHKIDSGSATPLEVESYLVIKRLSFVVNPYKDEDGKPLIRPDGRPDSVNTYGISKEVFINAIERGIDKANEANATGMRADSNWVTLANAYTITDTPAVMVAQSAP
jgi:hypothetical protein